MTSPHTSRPGHQRRDLPTRSGPATCVPVVASSRQQRVVLSERRGRSLSWETVTSAIALTGLPALDKVRPIERDTRGDRAPALRHHRGPSSRSGGAGRGMLASILTFPTGPLLFRSKALENAPARLAEVFGSQRAGATKSAAREAEARHELVVAIARNLGSNGTSIGSSAESWRTRYWRATSRAITHRSGWGRLSRFASTETFWGTSRALGIPPGVPVLDVVYSAQPLPSGPLPPMTSEMRERNRAAIRRQNCLFEKMEMRPRNIGHVKLNGFGDPIACRETVDRAMASLNNADALIIDLRDNGGGLGETALRIAGYLFDRPTFLLRSPSKFSRACPNRFTDQGKQACRQTRKCIDVLENAVGGRIFRLQPEDVEAGHDRRGGDGWPSALGRISPYQ